MAITKKICCDVCGKEKQAVNHWLMSNEGGGDFLLHQWDEDVINNRKHYCGAECVTKAVSLWMQKEQN